MSTVVPQRRFLARPLGLEVSHAGEQGALRCGRLRRAQPAASACLARSGRVKQAAEIFRNATPGTHEIPMQVAEGDVVVSYVVGREWG